MTIINNMLSNLNGERFRRLVICGLVISVVATLLGSVSGYTDINFGVLWHFFLAACQRVPLIAALATGIVYVVCRISGIDSFGMIKDSNDTWVAITVVGSIFASIAITALILR